MGITQLEAAGIDAQPSMPRTAAHLLPRVELSLIDGDTMFAGSAAHYLTCGASALNAIQAALASVNSREPSTILDFGAGAGRVTRWLRAAYPRAELSASDLPGPHLHFVQTTFGASTWASSTDLNAIVAPETYDLIWAGSVITHLDADTTSALLEKLYSWLEPNGLLIASFHGRFAKAKGDAMPDRYIATESWKQITTQCDASGYGYADYAPNSPGYGVSLCTIPWIVSAAGALGNARVAYLAEHVWDGHHDVVAFQRLS